MFRGGGSKRQPNSCRLKESGRFRLHNFYSQTLEAIEESQFLMRKGINLLLMLDRFAVSVTFRKLKLFKTRILSLRAFPGTLYMRYNHIWGTLSILRKCFERNCLYDQKFPRGTRKTTLWRFTSRVLETLTKKLRSRTLLENFRPGILSAVEARSVIDNDRHQIFY